MQIKKTNSKLLSIHYDIGNGLTS